MNVTVLTIPHSGTRFMAYFLREICGVDARFIHFQPMHEDAIKRLDGVKIIMRRDRDKHRKSLDNSTHTLEEWEEFRERMAPHDAIWVSIDKHDGSEAEMRKVVEAVGAEWTPEVQQFVDAWEPIGKRGVVCPKSRKVLADLNKIHPIYNAQQRREYLANTRRDQSRYYDDWQG